MSNALAIAGVSAVLVDLLNNGLIDHEVSTAVGVPVEVSALQPDRIELGEEEKPQLNLFLYQATSNAGWSNVGLPFRDSSGARLTNQPLALDLHYLLTAYGKKDFDAEILLGYAMQLLHETPALSRAAIRTALGPGTGGLPVDSGALLPLGPLAASDLADQVEQIKISPQNMSTEELSKLWTALGAHYRPTAAYLVSVVLIESKKSTRNALPVRRRHLYALPFDQPYIDEVSADVPAGADNRVTLESTLLLLGRNLKGEDTLVRLGELELPPPPLAIGANAITFPLASLTSLRAGAQTVQVIQRIEMGSPKVAHRGFESNAVAFMLHPTITAAVSGITNQVVDGVTIFAGTLTATFNPRVDRGQRVTLLLNEFNAPNDRPSYVYSFAAPNDNGIIDNSPDTDTIAFTVSGMHGGDYLVRLQVDGAESLLVFDGTQYSQPRITMA